MFLNYVTRTRVTNWLFQAHHWEHRLIRWRQFYVQHINKLPHCYIIIKQTPNVHSHLQRFCIIQIPLSTRMTQFTVLIFNKLAPNKTICQELKHKINKQLGSTSLVVFSFSIKLTSITARLFFFRLQYLKAKTRRGRSESKHRMGSAQSFGSNSSFFFRLFIELTIN